MLYHVVNVEAITDEDKDIWDALNKKLEVALKAVDKGAIVRLKPEMGADIHLLEWLANWRNRYNEYNLLFAALTEDSLQKECLELAHPDLKLTYVTSMNEVPRFFMNAVLSNSSEKSKEAPPNTQNFGKNHILPQPLVNKSEIKKAPTIQELKQKTPSQETIKVGTSDVNISKVEPNISVHPQLEKQATQEEHKKKDEEFILPVQKVSLKVGIAVSISGEYECLCCTTPRMYLRGDCVRRCENKECRNPYEGVELRLDLF